MLSKLCSLANVYAFFSYESSGLKVNFSPYIGAIQQVYGVGPAIKISNYTLYFPLKSNKVTLKPKIEKNRKSQSKLPVAII